MESLVFIIAGLIAIALANLLAPKVAVAAPLILVVAGIAASFIPALTGFELDPEWILVVLLPPLLYAAAVAMPSTDFRRELSSISALSIVLVIVSAIALGFFFSWIIPDLDIWWGIALGAVVSPTDAAATAIAKKQKLSGRLIAILEGESLFNDATAITLLRTAIAAAAISFSFWEALGQFLFSMIVASLIGVAAGYLMLRIRAKAPDGAISTVLSFVTPFLASIPAEHVHASGLVAAVAAGLVTGHGSIRWLNAEQRLSDRQTWHPVELILEGAIFLIMGLQVTTLVNNVIEDHEGIGLAVIAAFGALAITLIIRAALIAPMLYILRGRNKTKAKNKRRLQVIKNNMQSNDPDKTEVIYLPEEFDDTRRVKRVRRYFADADYYLNQPLGKGAGVVLLWCGMRGAITLAAAQTLPADTPHRSLLVLIAFIAATASLLIQGLSLKKVIGTYAPKRDKDALDEQAELLLARVRAAADKVDPNLPRNIQLAKRSDYKYRELRKARSEAIYDSDVLRETLAKVDAEQLYRKIREG